jgi:hypothetical protein
MAVPVTIAGAPEFGAPVSLFDTRISDSLRFGILYDVSPDGQRFTTQRRFDHQARGVTARS